MFVHPLIEKLNDLKLHGMARALAEQLTRGDCGELTFEDRLGLLADRETNERDTRSLTRRLQHARLRYQAAVEDIDFRRARSIDKRLVLSLASCDWVRKHRNLLVTGKTGVGKSYIACALAQKACREGFSARYVSLANLTAALETGRTDGSLPRLLRSFDRSEVLVIDDFGLTPLTQWTRADLFRILEDRYERRSTVVVSQFPVEQWHDLINDPTLADAILDRVVHNAYRVAVDGESMRKTRANESDL